MAEKNLMMRKLFLLFLTLSISSFGAISLEEEIDHITSEAIQNFNVPGASISIVINDQVFLSRGYGFRYQNKQLPVTEQTLFPIASCTKAFTALVLSQLVDEGKLELDDPVQKYIPELYLVDQERTSQLTIRDILAHRTGMARHDAIWICSEIPRSSVIGLLKNLEPVCDLRQDFQYNNFMYTLAGTIIERLTGQSWEEAVSYRLLKPLEMNHSLTSLKELQSSTNFSDAHAEIKGKITSIPFRSTFPVNPGGGIISNALDMANWLKFQLGLAQLPNLDEAYKIQMPFSSSPNKNEKTYHLGYGLGWFIGKYRDYNLISHGGDIDGFASEVAFLPEKGIGIVILTNSSTDGRYAISSIRNQIFDQLLGIRDTNWSEKYQEIRLKNKHALHGALEIFNQHSQIPSAQPLEAYVGHYTHPAYGTLEIKIENNNLLLTYGKLTTPLYYKSENTFSGQLSDLLNYGVNPVIDFKFFTDPSATVYQVEIPFEGFRFAKPITFTRDAQQ